jgi:hypothetical protein
LSNKDNLKIIVGKVINETKFEQAGNPCRKSHPEIYVG